MDMHRKILRIYIKIIVLVIAGGGDVSAILDITITASLGKRATLPCRVQPYGTKDNTVIWYMGNTMLSYGTSMINDDRGLEITKPAPNEFNLIIKSVVRSNDEETFICNSSKGSFSKIKLEVQRRPAFKESMSSPYHVTLDEGNQGQLNCIVEGKPSPTITWYRRPQKEDAPFQSKENIFTEIDVTGHTLTMQNVTRYVNDVFMCNASNVLGHVTRLINVTVDFPPEVDIFEEEIYALNGEQVVVTCLIQGSPLVDFYWNFTGKAIRESTWKYTVHEEHESGYPAYFLTLMIRQINSDDFGTYICHAEGRSEVSEDEIEIVPVKHR